MIGSGARAGEILPSILDVKGMRLVAVCDVEPGSRRQFRQKAPGGQKWGVYQDFRRMIDKEKLDAVMVETTTHARAWIVVQAMQAGLDTYIEKPMCLTIAEGRAMVRRRAKVQSRYPGWHAATVDADE